MKINYYLWSVLALSPVALALSPAALAQSNTPVSSYSWQQPHAGVVTNGPINLVWQPQPFRFQVGKSVRYIDFEKGSNANDGKTAAKPWKHHPWDAAAPANIRNQRGIDTFVFKRGVTYRGALKAAASGTAAAAIRLTSDPKWGSGEATIAGSDLVQGAWRRVSDLAAHGLPAAASGKVWMTRLPEGTQPMLLWLVGQNGDRQRLPIAREPNWRVSDPHRIGSEWWRWEKTDIKFPELSGTDAKNLTAIDPQAYVGATVWSDPPTAEFSWNPPEPSVVKSYDPATRTLHFMANHPEKYPKQGSRYFMENLPRFLDEAGEWLYRAEGPHARTLYMWMPDGQTPNGRQVEIARRLTILEVGGQNHINVSGLTLRGGNAPDPSTFNSRRESFIPDKWLFDMGAIYIHGASTGLTVANCKLEKTAAGIVSNPASDEDVIDHLMIRDSEFLDIDEGGVYLFPGTDFRKIPKSTIKGVRVLRNRMEELGMRVIGGGTRGIAIGAGELIEVAGNIAHRIGGQAIDVTAGPGAKSKVTPLTRALVHHNKAIETLLVIQDFGGIEGWGSGPSYFYNNISAVPVGWIRHNDWFHKNEAYYFDHQFKGYFFNNIGWSITHPDAWENTQAATFFQQAGGNRTTVFHNTAFRFRHTFNRVTYHQGNNRELFLGNLAMAATSAFLGHGQMKGNTTSAHSRNLFVGQPKHILSVYQQDTFTGLDDLQRFLGQQKTLASDVGWLSTRLPVVNAEEHDFRPLPDSATVNRGVKVFVPWGLSGVTGEWHFRKYKADPTTLIGDNFFSTPELGHIGNNTDLRNDLRVEGATEADYEPGVLEDWTEGALKLDGVRTAVQPAAARRPIFADLDMNTNNFLIEAYVRVDARTANGTIAGKLTDAAGYALRVLNGRVNLLLRSGGRNAQATGTAAVNDGKWHHIVAETDRKTGALRIYVDGKLAASSKLALAASTSLVNDAQFAAGKGIIGALDFLRVSRGTVADAQTTIAELRAWQFNGPHLRDFAGRAPGRGQRRAIGALEPAIR